MNQTTSSTFQIQVGGEKCMCPQIPNGTHRPQLLPACHRAGLHGCPPAEVTAPLYLRAPSSILLFYQSLILLFVLCLFKATPPGVKIRMTTQTAFLSTALVYTCCRAVHRLIMSSAPFQSHRCAHLEDES